MATNHINVGHEPYFDGDRPRPLMMMIMMMIVRQAPMMMLL
jgi:hypothetical protein